LNTKKLVFSMLIVGFAMWIFSGIWHNLILANLYAEIGTEHEAIGILILAYFILALILASLFLLGATIKQVKLKKISN